MGVCGPGKRQTKRVGSDLLRKDGIRVLGSCQSLRSENISWGGMHSQTGWASSKQTESIRGIKERMRTVVEDVIWDPM